jgi:hypothetical protein
VRKAGCGKASAASASSRLLAVRQLLLGPGQEVAAARLEELAQRFGGMRFDEAGFLLAGDVEVHQRQVQFGQPARLAQEPAIDLGLRPVQVAVVGGLPRQVAAMRLDLFQPVGRGS